MRNGFDKVEGIRVVLFHASGGDGENVGVEDNIAGLKADSLGENGVCTLTDSHLVLDIRRLSRLIKGHYDDGCSVAPAGLRLLDKALFPLAFGLRELTMPLPCKQRSPASITENLELSTIMGSRAIWFGCNAVYKAAHRLL